MIAKTPGGCQPTDISQQCPSSRQERSHGQADVYRHVFSLLFIHLQASADAGGRLPGTADEHWEWQMRENPVWASRMGDRRYNDQWADMSLEAIERRQEEQRDFLRQLRLIDSSELDETDSTQLRPVPPTAGKLD